MAAIEPDFKRLTQDEILALLEREADAEVPVERISSCLEEPDDEAFLDDPLLIEPEEEQLPCESILGPKSNESDDSGRGSGDIPMDDPRSRKDLEMEEKGVIGLVNLGNSCYMNAGLQCLLSTPALVEYFGSRHNETRGEHENSRAKLLRTFGSIFNKVWGRGPHRPTDGILKLPLFKLHLGQCHGVFKGTGQQDCQEFITLLLDTLDEQLKVNILRGEKESKETKNGQPVSVSTAPKQNDLARSFAPSSTVNSSSSNNSPLKLSSMFNRRVYLPKVKNSVKSLNALPELSIFTTFPNLLPSNAQGHSDENNIHSDYQVAKASGFSKFGAKQQKTSKSSPPAKRVRLGSENGRSQRTAVSGIQELKILDDDDEEDSQRVPELNGNVNQVSNMNECELTCELGLHPQTQRLLLWKANQIAAGIGPQNPPQVETFETETTCSVITTAFEGVLTRTITCANCNHSRSESEPFKTLTLPIPRDADRLIQLFFVSIYDVDSPLRWTKHSVTLRLSQTVKDLKETFVSMLAKSDHDCQRMKMEDLVMAYVWDHQIHEYIPDDVQVRFVNETKSLYLFQVNSDFPNAHNNGFPNGHNNSPLAEQESFVDYDASTLVLDEETTLCTSDLESSTSKTECASCAICWKTYSRDNVRVNAECECVLCLECIEELTKKGGKNEKYKCPQCTQIVAFKSLCPVDVLKLCRIVYMNQTWGERCFFGCPMMVRLPSQLLVQDLREFFTQVGVELSDDDRYDILLLSYSPQRCVTCGPDSYCRGCPLLRSGQIFIPDCTTIVIRFLDLLPQDMEYFNPPDMADVAGVDFDLDYTFVQAFHINDCLDLYTGKETLERPSLCVQCQKTGEASKSLAISHCPDYVILNVERHGFGISEKLENPIEFNLKLDLSKYLASGCTQDANYDLYGVVCHSGGASWGHYTAYVKNPWTLKWYFCDDSKVVPQDPDQLIYSSAYILFWSRQGTSLKSDLEFAPCRPKTPPPILKNDSPVLRPSTSSHSPVLRASTCSSHTKKSCKVIGLSRRKRPQVLPQASSSSSHNKIPRKTLFVGKEKTYSPTIRNEIMADWTDDEAEESRKAGDSDDNNNCTNFIGRNDHLPYYQGLPPNVLNGHIDPNVTYTLDSDPLQVDDAPVDFTVVSDPLQKCDSWR